MEKSVYGVILAGGHGSRMGNMDKPKQFLEVGGRPVIIHTVEKFVVNPEFEKIIVLVPKQWLAYTRDIIHQYISLCDRVVVIEGGDTRNETVMNSIRYIESEGKLNDETIIVTHDSVRPFVTYRIIEENIRYARKCGACDTVIPASDTIVESSNGEYISHIPDRKMMYQGQTPQSFRLGLFDEVYAGMTAEELEVVTDACKMFFLRGHKVYLVEGEVTNFKITYPFDLKMAATMMGEYTSD